MYTKQTTRKYTKNILIHPEHDQNNKIERQHRNLPF